MQLNLRLFVLQDYGAIVNSCIVWLYKSDEKKYMTYENLQTTHKRLTLQKFYFKNTFISLMKLKVGYLLYNNKENLNL